jgi:hypothetical protein
VRLALVLCLLPTITWAHGDFDWIRKGHYTTANGTHCCSERDCHRGGVSNLKRVEGGYEFDAVVDGKVQRLRVPDAGVHGSVDSDYWWCALPADLAGDAARCLFVPGTA